MPVEMFRVRRLFRRARGLGAGALIPCLLGLSMSCGNTSLAGDKPTAENTSGETAPGAARALTLGARAAADRPLIIAHRGASAAAPENTLPAFELALAAGADLVELDYYHSADGVPVVFHDKTLDRTTNAPEALGQAKLKIGDLTLADLRRLDAGAWFGAKFAGAKVPTLDESLDLIQRGSITLVEHKAGDAATCVRLLERKRLVDKVVVQSFDWAFLRECRRLSPALVLGALGGGELTPAKLAEIQATGAQIVGWDHKRLTAREIGWIHKAELRAWAYTVNDAARARELVAAGLDGVITDRPAELRQALRGAPGEPK